MRVEFDADRHLRADDVAHAFDQVAFAVVVTVGHHGAMQAQHHGVDRHRGAQLPQHLVTQGFVGLA